MAVTIGSQAMTRLIEQITRLPAELAELIVREVRYTWRYASSLTRLLTVRPPRLSTSFWNEEWPSWEVGSRKRHAEQRQFVWRSDMLIGPANGWPDRRFRGKGVLQ